jgi:hypothetical protein
MNAQKMRRLLVGAVEIAALAGGVIAVLASGGGNRASYKQVVSGTVGTPGTTIKAENGSFMLQSGRQFQTPFTCFPEGAAATPEAFTNALKNGGMRVSVNVEGQPPLHGILCFYGVNEKAQGPASRSYYIQVPESYIQATSEGRVSVVCETTEIENDYAWILWLSQSSFP